MEIIIALTLLVLIGTIGIVVGAYFRSILTVLIFYFLFMALGIVSFEGLESVGVDIMEWWKNE